MELQGQGSQKKTVRKQTNIVKGWVLHEADLDFIRKIKREHPTEFFKGVIQCLPKDLDIGDDMKEIVRTFLIRSTEKK
jgi:hypothetical protein